MHEQLRSLLLVPLLFLCGACKIASEHRDTPRLIRTVQREDPEPIGTVVFLHGLDGNELTSWQQDELSNWPRWVSQSHANLEVLSVGYEASATKWRGQTMPLKDRATNLMAFLTSHGVGERPVVFICHSFGGLVVKQLMRSASDYSNPGWDRFLTNTKGVVFLATPHFGSNLANWTRYFNFFMRRSVTVEELESFAPALVELNDWYRENSSKHNIATLVFFEKQKTSGVRVVDDISSNPGIVGSKPIPVDADHVSICKPQSKGSVVVLGVDAFLESQLKPMAMSNVGGPRSKRTKTPDRSLLEHVAIMEERERTVLNLLRSHRDQLERMGETAKTEEFDVLAAQLKTLLDKRQEALAEGQLEYAYQLTKRIYRLITGPAAIQVWGTALSTAMAQEAVAKDQPTITRGGRVGTRSPDHAVFKFDAHIDEIDDYKQAAAWLWAAEP